MENEKKQTAETSTLLTQFNPYDLVNQSLERHRQ